MKNTSLKLIISLLLFSLLLLGCSDSASNDGKDSEEAKNNVSMGEKEDLILSTGGTAGTYYVVAAAMSETINAKSDKVNVIVQPSKGSIENINLVHSGSSQLGMSNADGVYFAAEGTEMYKDAGKQNISGLMSLYMSAGQMATLADSGIENYGDLRGKKVCLGPPSTTIIEMSKAILREYGIDPEKDIQPYFLSFDEGLQKLTDGEIDATFFVAGVPTSAMISSTSTNDVRLVDVDIDIINKIAEEMTYYEPYVIKGGTYKGTDKDINTLKIYTEIFVSNDVSEEAAYNFVKTALENVEEYKEAHVVIGQINPEQAANTSAPLHPGALKYYQEIGVIK